MTLRLRARAITPRPEFARATRTSPTPEPDALRPQRAIWWTEQRASIATPVYDGELLRAGNTILGPAIIETRDTTVVVHPGTTLAVDNLGNFELTFGAPQ